MNHERMEHRIAHFAPTVLFEVASWQTTKVSQTSHKSDRCSERPFPSAKRSQILDACMQTIARPCRDHGIPHGLEGSSTEYHVARHRSGASGAETTVLPSPTILQEEIPARPPG